MASKPKAKQSASKTTPKKDEGKVEALQKRISVLQNEILILRREFDPKTSSISEMDIQALYQEIIDKLELELKEEKEKKPTSSTDHNDKKLKELQEENSELSKQIANLKREQINKDNTYKKLQDENKEIRAMSSSITKERDNLRKEVGRLTEELKNSADKQQSTGGNVSDDLEKAISENKDMKVNLSSITKERDNLRKEVERQKEELKNVADKQQSTGRNVSDDLEEARKKIKDMEESLSAVTKDRDDLKKKVDRLKEELTAVDDSKGTDKEKKENDAEIAALKKQISDFEREIESLNEKLTKESVEKVAMKAQISDFEDMNKSLNQKLKEGREEIKSLKNEKELMEKKNDELRTELKEEKYAKASMQKDLSKTKDDLKTANTQIQNTSASSSKEEVQKLKKENEDYKKKVTELQSTIADLKKKNNTVESRGSSSSAEVSKLRKEIIGLKDENDHLKTRLSELVGAKLTENNPDIADLSDMNRPQKLGEMYSELYDNEWTDAFEEIETSGESESVVIKHLHTILWEASAFCEDLSFQYTKKLDSVLFRIPDGKENNVETSEMPVTIRKQIKDLRKGISPYLKADVSEKYVLTSKEKKIGVNLKQFMKRCAELCWLMRMQDPPVVLTKKNNAGPFNGELYRTYTKSGKTVDFVVWPPLLLHDNGPTLAKGVAQGK